MNKFRLMFYCATLLTINCLYIQAATKNPGYISTSEFSEVMNNRKEKYVYLGKQFSDLYGVISRINSLDNNPNSITKELQQHIEEGFSIGLYDSVVSALNYAEQTLLKNALKIDRAEAHDLANSLEIVVDQLINETLTIDPQEMTCSNHINDKYCCSSSSSSSSFSSDDNDNDDANIPAQNCQITMIDGTIILPCPVEIDCSLKVFGKTVFKDHVIFRDNACFEEDVCFKDEVRFKDKVKFDEKVTFKENVTIEGTLTTTDFVVLSCIESLCINNLTVTDIIIPSGSCLPSLCVGTLSVTDLVLASCINNLCVNNLSITDLAVASCIENLCVTNLTVSDLIVTNISVTGCISNLCVNNLSVVDESVSGTLSANNAVINNLTVTNASVIDCITNLCVINLSVTDESVSGTLSVNNEIVNNLTVNNCINNLCVIDLSVVNESVSGTLSVNDLVAGVVASVCDLSVGCNIIMHNTASPLIGNIIKDGNSFIHNAGTDNTFVGINAGNFAIVGNENTGVGRNALFSNTTGFQNNAIGGFALVANTIGQNNNAMGAFALSSNTTGNINTAIGGFTLSSNVTGSGNTALGYNTGFSLTTGDNNTFLGNNAGSFITSGTNNIAIGFNAGLNLATGSNNIYVSNTGLPVEVGTIRIGTAATHTAAYMQGIFGATVGGTGIPVFVDAAGQLGTVVSSRRFKHDIQDMNADLSENIYTLRPVSFVYNTDENNTQQYGLIAEEVDQIFPELVIRDEDGAPYTVRYHLLPILLLNEVQKMNTKVINLQEQVVTLEELKADSQTMKAIINNLLNRMAKLEARA